MSCKKKEEKKIYQRFRYDEKDLAKALAAVHSGISISRAAAAHNIPKSTLHNKFSGKVPIERKMGPKSILTKEEEGRIEKWILCKAQVGFPMHPDEIKNAVRCILQKAPRENPFTDNRPGEKWFELFLKRHPEIRKKNAEITSKARAITTEEGLRNWFADAKTFLEEIDAIDVLNRPRSIFNGDSTGVQTCPKSGKLLGARVEKNFNEIANGKEKECITVMCTLSGAGEAIPPMIVFPHKRIPVHIAQSVPDKWPIGRSDSGWMVHATFYEYFANVFYPWCLENKIQFPVLYFLDGHKSHISLELLEFCVEHKIILYCLPPSSTHIMQPCDIAIFKPLEAHWKKVISDHKQKTEKVFTKSNFAPLFKTAFDRLSLNPEIIRNGFRACGLFPFDENAVNYSKCISTRRASVQRESEGSSFSIEDFVATKKVIEHFIGPANTEIFAHMRSINQEENVMDPLFTIWKVCTNREQGIDVPNDAEMIAEIADTRQKIQTMFARDKTLQDVENVLSLPVEELIDSTSRDCQYTA